ncbi:FxsA family protein [Paracoccus alkanivorans]|uniref:FxsA family protein n=1 Tax=Paracoccus alkanivorans TaxID=2116655 RepID=A0A3M0MEF1_9RHOB|nr:FxsA family protein [Paracoccus alkanivorans]RMC34704.1 FxsA family protein [Paracoccus alkanivorans]
MSLFWLFLAVPIIEIALFIQIGGLIGLWPTLGIVVLTAIAGTALLRSQGARAWGEVNRSFSELRDPTRPLAHGVMILVAGMLLLTPGFFTDTVGLLLLIPGMRNLVMRKLASRIHVAHVNMAGSAEPREPHRPPYGEGVIDGDYVVEDEPRRKPPVPPDISPSNNEKRGNSGWTRH